MDITRIDHIEVYSSVDQIISAVSSKHLPYAITNQEFTGHFKLIDKSRLERIQDIYAQHTLIWAEKMFDKYNLTNKEIKDIEFAQAALDEDTLLLAALSKNYD